MKKTTLLTLAVLCTTIFNYSFGRSTHDSLTKDEPLYITTLVINADVNVVLVNNDEAMLEATGGTSFKKFVTLEKTGDILVISSARSRNFYDATIYVPASRLRKIHVNSKAHVRSLFALEIPRLDVIINGACEFAIPNIGEVNVVGTENYSFDQDIVVRRLPASLRRKKE